MNIKFETFEDKAVEELAQNIANCMLTYEEGHCNGTCNTCPVAKKYGKLLSQLSDYDQLRVDRRSHQIYTANKFLQDGSPSQTIRTIVISVILIAVIFVTIVLVTSYFEFKPSQSVKESTYKIYRGPNTAQLSRAEIRYYETVYTVLDKTSKYVIDYNHDFSINCIDYAITFKKLWDTYYDPKCCEIVRNYWEDHFNHLFIRIRFDVGERWEYIEPQASIMDDGYFYMEDCWSSEEYNPIYNILGETNKWLMP